MPRFSEWFVVTSIALVLDATFVSSLGAQAATRDHYTPSFGVMGAATLDAPRTSAKVAYDQRPGWSAGAWFNVPLGFGISLEPQLNYWAMSARHPSAVAANRAARTLLDDATVGWLSAPLLIKVHAGRVFALTLGAQADMPLQVRDTPNYWTTDSIASVSFAGTAGFELLPHSRLVLFGRYTTGVSELRSGTVPAAAPTYRLQGAVVGLKWRIRGTHVRGDRDGDGVVDPRDRCEKEKGSAQNGGCPVPDTDKDGVPDDVDACPRDSGTADAKGCAPPPSPPPVLDIDGDGVPDTSDRCPRTAGSPQLNGCPDSDGDGFEDAVDKCPQAAGVATTRGCPRLLGFISSDVTFDPGTAKLTTKGRAELDKITAYLKMYPGVTVELVGHTSNSVPLDVGIGLSVRRAEAARDFLNIQGIALERMSVRGEGGRRPMTSNSTLEGRILNNRIEAILR